MLNKEGVLAGASKLLSSSRCFGVRLLMVMRLEPLGAIRATVPSGANVIGNRRGVVSFRVMVVEREAPVGTAVIDISMGVALHRVSVCLLVSSAMMQAIIVVLMVSVVVSSRRTIICPMI